MQLEFHSLAICNVVFAVGRFSYNDDDFDDDVHDDDNGDGVGGTDQ